MLVALTFDDGPSVALTPTILDTLKANGVRVTFFVSGNATFGAGEQLARRAVAEGHELACHGWSHREIPGLGEDQQTAEIAACWRRVKWLAGRDPALFRYPWGKHSGYGDWWISRLGMTRVRFHDPSVSEDWGCPGADHIVADIVGNAVDQAVVVLHDGGKAVNCDPGQLAYLPRVIDGLRARGFDLGRVVPSTTYSELNSSFVKVVAW
jgi:peptidoglycan-N-acetylglucosamine deacetylase